MYVSEDEGDLETKKPMAHRQISFSSQIMSQKRGFSKSESDGNFFRLASSRYSFTTHHASLFFLSPTSNLDGFFRFLRAAFTS